MAADDVNIIIRELAPLLFDLAFHLFPISFDAVPIHSSDSFDVKWRDKLDAK
jgi:hypothetical protein